MADELPPLSTSTPRAVAAEAQSREGGAPATPALQAESSTPQPDGLGTRFQLGKNVARVPPHPLKRQKDEPVFRPLYIYAIDPATSRLAGAIARINVPYEPLQPGPQGRLFWVDNFDGAANLHYRRVDLDDKALLINGGHDPTPSDPRFHQQMVYAVCSNVYSTFRGALGRQIGWGFDRLDDPQRLHLQPHAFLGANAYYDKALGALRFGYTRSTKGLATDRTLPGSFVFTCLSHDVIAHEFTHAVLDGLRANFTVPSGPDVIAFHEAFADLVAIFSHFSYPELVLKAIREDRGDLGQAKLLAELASQLGHATGKGTALRDAIETGSPKLYDPEREPHELGRVLSSAVFEAFLTVYRRKTERFLRLATGGTGVLAPGELPADLQAVLAGKAAQLADQFLAMLIRAIDYCPPVDLSFGEYLRALVTADYDLVPEDKFGYREALIDAFLRRNIYPRHVNSLSEDALLWRPTTRPLNPVVDLDFAHLQFQGDPGNAAGAEELRRQACVLGEFVSRRECLAEFGLVARDDPRLNGCIVDLPTVESIRSARRVGPDGQVSFDIVAEILQRCAVPKDGGRKGFEMYGGATVILGPEGEFRYSIAKSVLGSGRLQRRRRFIQTPLGRRYWKSAGGTSVPRKQLFQLLHTSRNSATQDSKARKQ